MIRTLFAAAAMLVAASAFERAAAQDYPWCAHLAIPGETKNCGFTTWKQCMDTVSGVGGSCAENPFYVAAQMQAAQRKAKPKKKQRQSPS